MSLRYVRDDAHRRIRATLWDPVLPSEVRAISDHQIAEGTWHYSVLLDLREAIRAPKRDAISNLVAHMQRLAGIHGQRGPVATVSTRPALFRMAHLYAILAQEAQLNVAAFRDITSAEQWLSVIEERWVVKV
ncbi:MAG: hypothetical protein C5B57_02965 [Blastocatellia bacterium]|nr:MAG: hypothetical protein C5B57_02965 [Blastocatellia bacterium]